MIPAGVTGRVALNILPVMKTASEVAAIELASMNPPPQKVTKRGLPRLAPNLATNELVAVPDAAGKAAPPAPKTELVGIDIYLEWPSRNPNQLAEAMQRIDLDGLKLSTIANRGLKVWPDGIPETFCTDSFRCRYFAKQPGAAVTARHILSLLERVAAAGLDVVKTESLRNFDGKAGYTLSQGE